MMVLMLVLIVASPGHMGMQGDSQHSPPVQQEAPAAREPDNR